MYTVKNYKTKKALKEDIEAGTRIEFFQPGPFGGSEPENGQVTLEGPHYPEPHKWYGTATVKDSLIVKVI